MLVSGLEVGPCQVKGPLKATNKDVKEKRLFIFYSINDEINQLGLMIAALRNKLIELTIN